MSPMTSQSTLALEATGLVKTFGDTRAVDGVDLAVPSGSVYGVLGPNGAGKTTTIRMLATLLRPDAGSARVLGHDIVDEADAVRGARQPHRPARLGRRGPDRAREPRPARAAAGSEARRRQGARGRAAGGVRPRRCRRPAGQELLRGHAAPARHRGEHRRHARGDVPRRADDRARPALAQPGLGHHPRAGLRGDHDPALHPVPRRGRPARRRDRGDRPRQGDRRGHAGPAQGVGRVGRAACSPARPRAAARGRAGARGRARQRAPGARPGGALGPVRRRRAAPPRRSAS